MVKYLQENIIESEFLVLPMLMDGMGNFISEI